MHKENCFITLTYDNAHLKSPKLQYSHFQLFAKRLRSYIFESFLRTYGKANWALLDPQQKKETYEPYKISIFVTGEYGDLTKRPHWHALLFNYRPNDCIYKYSNHRGDQVFSSATLTTLWPLGISELGSLTFESAGYVARYAAKKLTHGNDKSHDFEPISKKSSHQAIGKKFLEKYYKEIFDNGYITIPGGPKLPIPRYYEKWFQKNHPDEYLCYLKRIKLQRSLTASKKAEKEQLKLNKINEHRISQGKGTFQTTEQYARTILTERRFKRLQKHLKGDI